MGQWSMWEGAGVCIEKIEELEALTLLKLNSSGDKWGPQVRGDLRSSSPNNRAFAWWPILGAVEAPVVTEAFPTTEMPQQMWLNSSVGWIYIKLFGPLWGVILEASSWWNRVPHSMIVWSKSPFTGVFIGVFIQICWNLCSPNAVWEGIQVSRCKLCGYSFFHVLWSCILFYINWFHLSSSNFLIVFLWASAGIPIGKLISVIGDTNSCLIHPGWKKIYITLLFYLCLWLGRYFFLC